MKQSGHLRCRALQFNVLFLGATADWPDPGYVERTSWSPTSAPCGRTTHDHSDMGPATAKLRFAQAMLDAYGRGEDLHTQTARLVLGVQDVTKGQRQLAKAVNFGLLYGMGTKGFRMLRPIQLRRRVDRGAGERIRSAFFRAYPGLRRWHGSIKDGPVNTRTPAAAAGRGDAFHREAQHAGSGDRGRRVEAGDGPVVGTPQRMPRCVPCAGGA